MKPLPPTADLCDAFDSLCTVCALPFRDFGARTAFAGPVRTVLCRGDNARVRRALEGPGGGAVLVVDGGGSLGCALLGDMLGSLGVANGWSGVLINGAVRDTAALSVLDLGVKALGTHPRRSARAGTGESDIPVEFGGARFEPGWWVCADADGVVVAPHPLSTA